MSLIFCGFFCKKGTDLNVAIVIIEFYREGIVNKKNNKRVVFRFKPELKYLK